ncbi:MAG: hypothetical protein DRH90_18810 [Deltaproteobacteria bacterium]|nr:MAG: hypothetical protein DRH90_18810 [Deltaproteobacteria bacterium]RLC11397.1 MAG: hypothetical protein DRI24_18840 [Deltaproteobacteria bacterium]
MGTGQAPKQFEMAFKPYSYDLLDISHMPTDFEKVISELGSFLVPPLQYASEARIFDKDRQPGGSWK